MAPESLVTQTIAGTTFGAALTASGVWDPSTILGQMKLQDFRMLDIFMVASSASALYMHLLSRSGYVPNKPKPVSQLFTGIPYDGNIIGGAMVGFGMTLTGACPGTVLVQVVTGTYPGLYSFAGAITGGVLYVALAPVIRRGGSCGKQQEEPLFLYKKYNINPDFSVLAYEAMCVAIISLATRLAPMPGISPFLSPVIGGLAVSIGQLVSLLSRKQPVGISTSYEELGVKLCSFFKTRKQGEEPKSTPVQAMAFSAGVMLGAFALARMVPRFAVRASASSLGISPLRAFLGGIVMVFGARVANGCTSGHGISGMSMLATSSIVTVASIFAGGMGLAQLIS